MAPMHMDVNDLFHSPKDRITAFSQMQLHLYRHDIRLQDYFEPLQLDTLISPRVQCHDHRVSGRLMSIALHSADKVSQFSQRQKIRTDVLLCPNPDSFNRKTETRFLVRTLLGLAQTDAKILCLLPVYAPCRGELETQLTVAGRRGQVTFIDPASPLNWMEERMRWRAARMRARAALQEIVQVLEPYGLSPSREVTAGFEHTAYFIDAWERLATRLEFEAVVARCHWHALCSPVCRTARQRGKPVITFQQGVIGTTLDVPVTASKYVAFGQPSASLLARVNRRFFRAAGMAEPAVEYVNGGSFFDTVTALPDQFARQTLLIVDVPNSPGDFHGVESQCRALLQLADRLLSSDLPLRHLVIRPHPYWSNLDFESCQRLIREHSGRCELSHPAWSLEDDLRRSSIVIGVWSGVLTVASASGLPTIFLQTEHGFTTADLACFSPRQTLMPDAAFCEIGKILSDERAYADARALALHHGQEYYAKGTNLDLSGQFFERLLRAEPMTKRAESR